MKLSLSKATTHDLERRLRKIAIAKWLYEAEEKRIRGELSGRGKT